MSVANLWDVSNANLTTAQGQPWGSNATERTLQSTGRSQQTGLWLRKISLVVYGSTAGQKGQFGDFSQAPGPQGGNMGGIDLSQMRVNFELTKLTRDTPNDLIVKVYNLSRNTGPATEQKIKQYARVQLAAGYQNEQYGMIFDGTVVLYIQGKENPVDSYIEIHAGDQDTWLNYAVHSLDWPAGTTPQKKVEDVLKKGNIPIGRVDLGPGQQPTLRASSYTGHAVSLIRDQTRATNSDFFIDDGKAYVIPWSGYRQSEMVVLSPKTGLVGIPKVTPAGIEVICLLNPKLRIGGLVQIDSSLLSGVPFAPGSQFDAQSGFGTPTGGLPFKATGPWTFSSAAISPTGTYKISLMKHYGDTRGNPWYTALICSASGPGGADLAKVSNIGTAYLRSRQPRSTGQAGSAGTPPVPNAPALPPAQPAPPPIPDPPAIPPPSVPSTPAPEVPPPPPAIPLPGGGAEAPIPPKGRR
jgi:hypothetical protein